MQKKTAKLNIYNRIHSYLIPTLCQEGYILHYYAKKNSFSCKLTALIIIIYTIGNLVTIRFADCVFGQADPNSVRLDSINGAGDRDQLRCGRRRTRSMSVQSGGAGGEEDDMQSGYHQVSVAAGPSITSVISSIGHQPPGTPPLSSGGSGGSADVVGRQNQRPPPPRRRRRTSSSLHQHHGQRPQQKHHHQHQHHHHYHPLNRHNLSSDSTNSRSCCTSDDDSADDLTSS